ncbi:MAG: hypothetical protein Q8S13_04800 [Dehalococcoidia bacterium]|nr:hypothetical protein [Dehalococcoidia bacterium]
MGALRFLRAFFSAISFGLIRRAEEIEKSADFIDGDFERGVREKQGDLQKLSRSAARIVAGVEEVKAKVEETEREVAELEDERAGAIELAKERRAAVVKAGGNPDEDKELLDLQQGFEAAEADLDRQQKALADFQEQLRSLMEDEKATDLQLSEMQRYVESLNAERGSVAARARFDEMMRDINEAKANIGSGTADAAIQRARANGRLLHAEAKVSGKMVGTDAKVRRAELRQAAAGSRSRSRFAELTGGAKAAEAAAPVAPVAEAPAGGGKGGSLPGGA